MTTFWEAIQTLPAAVDPAPIFFRAYYNADTGEIIEYSQQERDLPYIDITAAEYAESRYTLRVKNGKLVEPVPSTRKLVRSTEPTAFSADPDNIAIISSSGVFWKVKEFYNE